MAGAIRCERCERAYQAGYAAATFAIAEDRMQCELSVGVRRSEAVTLGNPVMPVADGFGGRFVGIDRGQLGERNSYLSALPTDLHEHVMLARILNGHA